MNSDLKKKIIITVAVCLVLILPTVAAFIAYSSARNNPVTRKSVSGISVVTPDGGSFDFSRKAPESGSQSTWKTISECFFTMNESGKTVDALPAPESEYKCFTVTYSSYNLKSEYRYYITRDPDNSYFRDSAGRYHKISSEAVTAFLSTEYATSVFPSAAQPTLTVAGTQNVLPQSMQWKFLGYRDEFYDGTVSVINTVPTCDVSGGLEIKFDTEPDYLYVELTDKDGNRVFEDNYDRLDATLFADNTVYNVTVTAKWYEADGRTNYGEGVYRFIANVLSPAVFYLNTPSIEYGDFVIVSAKNIVDKSLIGFTSEPAINFTPVFTEYGGYYHAVIPLSLDLVSANNKAPSYSFTFSYGGVYQELTVNASVRKVNKGYLNISADKCREYYNETTRKEFSDNFAPVFAADCGTVYWIDDNMLITPTTRNVRMGFGFYTQLSGTKETFTHEGVDFKVVKGDSVGSCLPGKVVFVGETKISGKTVVIDHGAGLKSLYANMSSTSVSVGDIIEKGHIIGVVGSTGLCAGTTLHFGLYAGNVPVRYYSSADNGVQISEAVRNAIAGGK